MICYFLELIKTYIYNPCDNVISILYIIGGGADRGAGEEAETRWLMPVNIREDPLWRWMEMMWTEGLGNARGRCVRWWPGRDGS